MQIDEWAYNRVLSLARLRGGEPVAAEVADVLAFAGVGGYSCNTDLAIAAALDPKYSYDTLAQVLYPHATPASQQAAKTALSRLGLADLLQEIPTFGAASYAKPKDFDEVTQAVPNRDTILAKGEERKIAATRLSYWLETGNFSAIREQYRKDIDELAHDALIAFSQGKIDTNSYTTALTFWALCTEYREEDVEILPLFTPDGEIYPKTLNYIEDTTFFSSGIASGFASYALQSEKWKQFYAKVRSLSPSNHYIFTVPQYKQGDERVIEAMLHSFGVNVLNRYKEQGKERRMVPPLGLMQAYLDIRFPRDGVRITPYVGGLSPIERIVGNGRKDTRDMGWFCPGQPPVSAADGFSTRDISDIFRFHDWYHAIMVSHIPKEHRYIFIELAEKIREVGEQYKDLSEFVQDVYIKLIDMEHAIYRKPLTDPIRRPGMEILQALSFVFSLANKNEKLSEREKEFLQKVGKVIAEQKMERFPTKEDAQNFIDTDFDRFCIEALQSLFLL